MPSRFQTMKCAASDEFTTSTAWMLLEYSWPMRWNTRSAPGRSTRTAISGYFASNAFASFSATGRSVEGYEAILPSLFAASIRAGETGSGGGAEAMTRVENAAPASKAPEPLSTARREIFGFFVGIFYPFVLARSVPRKLALIPTAHTESFVDSAPRLPLDLAAGCGQQPVQNKIRNSGD